jgi:membrane protease YdiL (CAAX protease family)
MEELVPPVKGARWVFLVGVATLLGFGGAGAGLLWAQGRASWDVFGNGSFVALTALGVAAGLTVAVGALLIIRLRWMEPVRVEYTRTIGSLINGWPLQLFVSVCAGVGEELFFRGALQHWLGVPLTAFVFVLLHGYLHPRDVRRSLYGGYLTVAMCGIGYLAEVFGLWSAMVAHTLIDVLLLRALASDWKNGLGSGQS